MAALFDRAHFDHMTGADKALQAEVLGLFRDQVAAWDAALRPEAGVDTWRDAAHMAKGSAKGIGLWALAEAAEAAEALGRGPEPSREEAAAALAAVRAALAEALAALAS